MPHVIDAKSHLKTLNGESLLTPHTRIVDEQVKMRVVLQKKFGTVLNR